MKNRIAVIGLFLAVALFAAMPARAADTFVTFCSPNGASAAGSLVQSKTAGNYTADANGCISFDVTKDPNGDGLHALVKSGWSPQNQVACAGQVALTSGTPSTATVTNSCFTAAANVVLCTDITAVNAVKCVASSGSLAITGAASVTDTISYARVK